MRSSLKHMNNDHPPIRIYVNKVEHRITCKIKTGYYLALLTLEMMKLLGSIKNRVTKVKNCENVPHLEISEVVLVHCNIASINNNYKHELRVFYTFLPNKTFAHLPNKSFAHVLDISPKKFMFSKTFNEDFSFVM